MQPIKRMEQSYLFSSESVATTHSSLRKARCRAEYNVGSLFGFFFLKKDGRGKLYNRSVTMVTDGEGKSDDEMSKEVLLLTIHICCLSFYCVCMYNLKENACM